LLPEEGIYVLVWLLILFIPKNKNENNKNNANKFALFFKQNLFKNNDIAEKDKIFFITHR
jgi:hypothetical protein